MNINKSDVLKVAQLAKLALTEDSLPQLVEDLDKVLKLVDEMKAVDTQAVSPLAHPLESIQETLRQDQVTETDQRDTLQQSAPDVEQGFYRVPKVIDN